jgi:integrase
MHLSVLRTVFDKLCGGDHLSGVVAPRARKLLPDVPAPGEARRVLAAGRTLRDQLLLGLLYGCGLKPGEVCGLRWRNIELDEGALSVRSAVTESDRRVPLPSDLLPVLREGVRRCRPEDFIFPGRAKGAHLGVRMLEVIVRRAARDAGLERRVTPMTLRHAFAVHALEAGESPRRVQAWLGHADLRGVLRYRKCTPPADAVSPLDRLYGTKQPVVSDPPRTSGNLFHQPLSADGLALPFSPPAAADFMVLLRMQIKDRFLALRRGVRPG